MYRQASYRLYPVSLFVFSRWCPRLHKLVGGDLQPSRLSLLRSLIFSNNFQSDLSQTEKEILCQC